MAKKKIKKKRSKKRSAKRRSKILRGQVPKEPYWLSGRRTRLKLPKFLKAKKLEDIELDVEAFDYEMLEDKKKDIKRRKKIFYRAEDFQHVLKDRFGRRIKIEFRFDDEADELHMLVHFRPKKHEHPFDADDVILEAFKLAKLDDLMENVGSGTCMMTMERDQHFVEKKPSVKRG